MDGMERLKHFLDSQGRLISYPSKHKMKIYALFFFAEKFDQSVRYTEKEVNELLSRYHTFDDPCLLRRELYNKRILNRASDGSVYWFEETQPELSQFGL